ncbi:MAG: hypothetical protein KC496_03655 [Anaerolineae bacterium]|nr:hypothetical protein [Anaerolineae bacterium]
MARRMYKVWFDESIEAEERLVKAIPTLKSQRRFTDTIRRGMKLVLALEEGDTSVLKSMFPEIVFALQNEPHTSLITELRAELQQLRADFESRAMPIPSAKPLRTHIVSQAVRVRDTSEEVAGNLMRTIALFED